MKKRLTPIARKLRRELTDAEKLLWSRLRARQIANAKFRKQAPVDTFVADFLCHEVRLIIEVDGGQHSGNEVDKARTRILEDGGFSVLRYWNNDIFENLEGVLEDIRQAVLNARGHN